jgi:hypothetical protein
MSYNTYSREYLRGLPVGLRKDFLRSSVERYVQEILKAARKGSTSYTVLLQDDNRGGFLVSNLQGVMNLEQSPPTAEELREAFIEFFPDSAVTYEEKLVRVSPGKQELKKRIIVEWS